MLAGIASGSTISGESRFFGAPAMMRRRSSSLTTTEPVLFDAKSKRFVAGIAIHPGETLLEEFLKPLSISQNRLAVAMQVPPIRISEIVRGSRAITPDTAIRLAACLGTSAEFWLNLQSAYDLAATRQASVADYRHLKPLVAVSQ